MMDRDKFEGFLAAINANKYDIDAWHGILRVIHNEKVENFRENVYERLVNVFPTSGKFWRIYIEHEVFITFIHTRSELDKTLFCFRFEVGISKE